MKDSTKRFIVLTLWIVAVLATVFVVVFSIVVGPPEDIEATPSSSASATATASVAPKAPEQAKRDAAAAALNSFIQRIRSDTKVLDPVRDQDPQKSFDKTYAESMKRIKPDSITIETARQLIGTFGRNFDIDIDATQKIDAEAIVLDGDTATIYGSSFTIIVDGDLKQKPDVEAKAGGRILLTLVDDTWMPSGFLSE